MSRSSRSYSVVEFVLVALPRPRLGAEAPLQPAGGHARRRPAGLRIAGAPAVARRAVAARLHALGLALLLGEVRRPGRVAETARLVAAREVVQRLERARLGVGVPGGIADRAQALGHGVEPQVAGLDVEHLVPGQRARHARVW